MRRVARRAHLGLTLVEAAVAISLVGIALAVFVPTFVRELHTSKVAEAAEMLDAIAARAITYYESRQPDGRRCLPGNAGPTPRTPSVEPTTIRFEEDGVEGHEAWSALGFQPSRPIRFSYSFESESGCAQRPEEGDVLFTITAFGDLDGDGDLSSFVRSYGLDEGGHLLPVGVTHVADAVE